MAVESVSRDMWLWLYVRSGTSKTSDERTARMRKYSWMIFEQMADQDVDDNVEQNSVKGWSVAVPKTLDA